jgi:hypothetical protein
MTPNPHRGGKTGFVVRSSGIGERRKEMKTRRKAKGREKRILNIDSGNIEYRSERLKP